MGERGSGVLAGFWMPRGRLIVPNAVDQRQPRWLQSTALQQVARSALHTLNGPWLLAANRRPSSAPLVTI